MSPTRYEKRHSNIPAHVSPCFRVKEGDHVIIGQCRQDLMLGYVIEPCLQRQARSLAAVSTINFVLLQAIVKDSEV